MSQRNEGPHLEAFFETKVSLKHFEEFKSMLMQEFGELRERVEALEDIVEPDSSTYEPEEEEEMEEGEEENDYDEGALSSDSESSTSDSGDSESDEEEGHEGWWRSADRDEL